jgi:SAM-dependent methyltransferase
MDTHTLAKVVKDRQLPLMLSLSKELVAPIYRGAFLAAASGAGVLRMLDAGPCDLYSIAGRLGVHDDAHLLEAWLDLGVSLGELSFDDSCYRLRSSTAKKLGQERNDTVAAALEEVVRFHVPVLADGPRMLSSGRRFGLGDQDGSVIARSTRVVQPFVEEAIERTLERRAAVRLLEVGCGSGVYVQYAAALNPRLSALAIDVQPDVAAEAAANFARWGLADRVETRCTDLADLDVEAQFDLITLHNNIYYFPEAERVAVLRRVRSLLAPGGRLLVTTSCRGGNASLEVLNLWFEYADFGGPLPDAGEFLDQLDEAGFADVKVRRLIPTEQFRAFIATNGVATNAPTTTTEESAS